MKEFGDIVKDVITTIYKSPKDLKQTGMSNDDGTGFQPTSSFGITYDAQQNQLEPIYYWFLDFIHGLGFKTEKIVDNFTSSPGSGHFSDMNQRATIMQDKAMQIFGALNQTIKSALNLVYDLREFRERLKHYEDYDEGKAKKGDAKRTQEAAFLALKQIWLDSVDLPKRGAGSIHQLTGVQTGGYTTLREAFMVAHTLKDLDRMQSEKEGIINEQVARILKPRLQEFLNWVKYSHSELDKRYKIEKSYLKSQISTIRLYSEWIKPYLKAAEDLRQQGFDGDSALVNAFSTTMFQLTIVATPPEKKWDSSKSRKRKYFPVILVDFRFRGHLHQKVTQRGDFAPQFGGRADVNLHAYSLNDQEFNLIKKIIKADDFKTALTFDNTYASDTIQELESDLREFLDEEEADKVLKKEPEKEKKKKEKRNPDDINPFSAVFSIFKGDVGLKSEKEEEIEEAKQIKKDNWKEKQIRIAKAKEAADRLFAVYDIYKKAHSMASTPTDLDFQTHLAEPSTYFSDVWRFDSV